MTRIAVLNSVLTGEGKIEPDVARMCLAMLYLRSLLRLPAIKRLVASSTNFRSFLPYLLMFFRINRWNPHLI